MKINGVLSFILALCIAVTTFSVPVCAETVPIDAAVEYGCHTVDGKFPLLGDGEKMETAVAAILYEANSQTLMYAKNADAAVYPASLVKIMTAMVAIEEGSLTDAVTVTQEILDTVPADAVSAGLLVDEVITLQDLLYCMMVGSANDAAAVLANHIAGNQAAFVVKMNQYAKNLGCTATEFKDVHGLDSQQRTTARDMARILSAALNNEEFKKLFGTVYYKTSVTNKSSERALATGNYLLSKDEVAIYYDERVTGSRTGIDNNGDRCVASTASANGMEMICVVLGAKSVYEEDGYSIKSFGGYDETSHLLDIGMDGFQSVQLLYENQVLLQNEIENGDALLNLGPHTGAAAVLPQGVTPDKLTYKYGNSASVALPVKEGQKMSDVQIWYGNVCVAAAELFALNKVENRINQAGNLDNSGGNSQVLVTILKVLVVLALVILAGFLGLRFYRQLRHTAARNRSRRHRRNRRRSR